MYWLENIDKYIEHYATPAIVQRGKTLFNIGSVRDIDYDTDNNKGTARVSGGDVYEVSIENGVSQDFRNIATSCNCAYAHGVCKHQVAALLSLKKKFEYNSSAVLKMIQFEDQLRQSGQEFTLEQEMLDKYNIDAQYPSMIRNDTFLLKYNNISPNLLAFEVGERDNSSARETIKYEKVSFYLSPDKVTTKCTCNSPVIEFCNHQKKVLHHIMIELEQKELLLNFPPLDALQEQAIKSYGLDSKEDVDKFFALSLGKSGPEYLPKDKEMISYSEHLYLIKRLEEIKETSPYGVVLGEATNNDSVQGISLFFDEHTDQLPLKLHIIAGRGNNTGDKIVSNVSAIDDPSQITPSLRGVFVEYERIRSLYNNHFAESIHPKMLEFMHKHLHTFREMPLYNMREKYSFRKADLSMLMMAEETVEIEVKCKQVQTQIIIEANYKIGDRYIPISEYQGIVSVLGLMNAPHFYLYDNIHVSKLATLFQERPKFKYAQKATGSFHAHIAKISELAHVVLPEQEEVAVDRIEPRMLQLNLEEKNDFLILSPKIKYSNEAYYTPGDIEELRVTDDGLQRIVRDKEFETEFIDRIKAFDNDWKEGPKYGFFTKPIESIMNTPWIFNLYAFCKENNIEIEGYNNLSSIRYNPNEAKVNIQLTSGIDWFESDIQMTFGDQEVDLAVLRKAVIDNENMVKLADGTEGLLPEEWMDKLSAIFRNSEMQDGKLLISKMKFNLIDELFDEIDDEQLRLEIDYRKRRLLDFDNIEKIEKPEIVQATLRPYQEEGLNWLNFLDEFGFGGCLADDMGLGKTLQVITFLAHKKETATDQKTHLVVVPKSLMFNWADEIEKFAPVLKYLIYHGSTRKTHIRSFAKYDIIISTYGTITNDIEDIMEFPFSYAVLDESHAIKNPNSKRYKAMRLLKADNKIVMTGTPIENQTFDLFAQFNFVNPGFFGSKNNFKLNYAEPIDVYGNEAASMELRKLVKPFLLRRTKEQVAKDLPPKTESVIHVDMNPKQRAVYDAFLQRYKNYVSQKISENGLQKSKMFVIEALLKLRQICNSPALLNEDEAYANDSAKIDILMERLSEIIPRHKVLVISQFTSMLGLIKERITQAQIPYCYLDGGTKNRKEIVDEFNNNDEYRVFLLSLKAGGVGLNLASAEYVFIVDPWWNPAAEAQAIDRAHRIGQENQVFAYRMICNDSIEEKIQLLQHRKSKMASDIIQVEESFMKSLDQDDIMALFS